MMMNRTQSQSQFVKVNYINFDLPEKTKDISQIELFGENTFLLLLKEDVQDKNHQRYKQSYLQHFNEKGQIKNEYRFEYNFDGFIKVSDSHVIVPQKQNKEMVLINLFNQQTRTIKLKHPWHDDPKCFFFEETNFICLVETYYLKSTNSTSTYQSQSQQQSSQQHIWLSQKLVNKNIILRYIDSQSLKEFKKKSFSDCKIYQGNQSSMLLLHSQDMIFKCTLQRNEDKYIIDEHFLYSEEFSKINKIQAINDSKAYCIGEKGIYFLDLASGQMRKFQINFQLNRMKDYRFVKVGTFLYFLKFEKYFPTTPHYMFVVNLITENLLEFIDNPIRFVVNKDFRLLTSSNCMFAYTSQAQSCHINGVLVSELNMKFRYMQMLLHIEENFDDDLLMDVMRLLHE